MQFLKVSEVFAIVLVPVTLGMTLRANAPGFAKQMDKPVKILSALFLAAVITLLTISERHNVVKYFALLGTPVLLFNLLSMGVGYYLPRLFRVEKKQAIAIGMEIGIHNATLAIYIALNVMHNGTMALPSGTYGLLMFFTAAVFGMLVSRKRASEA